MERSILLAVLLVMLNGTETMAATIGFDDLPGTGPFGTYEEAGFTVSPAGGNWFTSQTSGRPYPSIYAVLSASYDAGISVTRNEGDQEFRFESIDLSGDTTVGTAFIISGLDDGNAQVFSFELPLSYGPVTISASDVVLNHPLVAEKVRTLVIVGAHEIGRSGQFSVDNVQLTCSALACPDVKGTDPNVPVPEPASLLLLGIGLAGIGIRSWKWAKL